MKNLIKLNIEAGEYLHCLWAGASPDNFIKEEARRFVLLEGKNNFKGSMFFCDTYLEAILTRAYFKGGALYSDEKLGVFVVVSSSKRANEYFKNRKSVFARGRRPRPWGDK